MDIVDIEKEIEKHVPRFRLYEIRKIRKTYTEFFFQIEHKMLADYSEFLISLVKDSNLKIDSELSILFGEHLTSSNVLRTERI